MADLTPKPNSPFDSSKPYPIGSKRGLKMNVRANLKSCLVMAMFLIAMACPAAEGRTIYVDDDGSADFNNIQAAINDSNDGDTIIVRDGTYTGDGNRDIDFLGKAITLRSANGPENCIIDCNGTKEELHQGFYFHSGEGADSVIEGFTITNGYAHYGGGAIHCSHSSPMITNCIIRGNVAPVRFFPGLFGGTYIFNNGGGIHCYRSSSIIKNCYIVGNRVEGNGGGIGLSDSSPLICNCVIAGNIALHKSFGLGGAIHSYRSSPTIINCTVTENVAEERGGGIYCLRTGSPTITNSIFWANLPHEIYVSTGAPSTLVVTYSNVQDFWPGEGNIDVDPCFIDLGYWDPNENPADPNDDFWVEGDYHLKSQAGRWEPSSASWVQDAVTSPCIDAEDMASPIGYEPFPNGGRVNMGAYGGTIEASKSYFGEPVCETIVAGDINGDCIVNFVDFAVLAFHWLEDNRLPSQASNPSPRNYATGVSITYTILSWTPGYGAVSHDVYFGTTSPGSFCGNQTGTTFNPGPMQSRTTYYWRIDEVNPFGTTTGEVWHFTTTTDGGEPP